jgi:hypothetical protein
MPRPPKHRDLRQNTERRDIGEVPADDSIDAKPVVVPTVIRAWLGVTKVSWARYWASPARQATIESLDIDTLERLWTLYDERERAQRELRKPLRKDGKVIRRDSRLVEGSTGQMRPSGFYTVIARLDAEIRQLEDRVAKSMKSRLILGMVVGGDGGPASDGEDEPDSGSVVDDPDSDEPTRDPRLYLVERNAG